MAARAIWKGVIRFGDVRVPVKLYSAIEDRDVHFRLLHRRDKVPVKQAMVNPETDEVVPYQETGRAWDTGEEELVMLDREELEAIEPEASRDIEILHFLPRGAIDHRWFDRPYYLGPDDAEREYRALARALEDTDREGLARWVMRKKEYVGALRLHRRYPMLMSLRHADEVVEARDLDAPSGRALDEKELDMARQLVGMLEAAFEPEEYRNDYRERVLEMLESKRRGGEVKVVPMRRRKPPEDLTQALEASLRKERKHA